MSDTRARQRDQRPPRPMTIRLRRDPTMSRVAGNSSPPDDPYPGIQNTGQSTDSSQNTQLPNNMQQQNAQGQQNPVSPNNTNAEQEKESQPGQEVEAAAPPWGAGLAPEPNFWPDTNVMGKDGYPTPEGPAQGGYSKNPYEHNTHHPLTKSNNPGASNVASLHRATFTGISKLPKMVGVVPPSGRGIRARVVQTHADRIAGFQAYPSYPGYGLLFPFGCPVRAAFHMGTVSFPIDMLFLRKVHTDNDSIGLADDAWVGPRIAATAEAIRTACESGWGYVRLGTVSGEPVGVKIRIHADATGPGTARATARIDGAGLGPIMLYGSDYQTLAKELLRYVGSQRVDATAQAARWMRELKSITPNLNLQILNAHARMRRDTPLAVLRRVAATMRSELGPWLSVSDDGTFRMDGSTYQVIAMAQNIQPGDTQIYSASAVDAVLETRGRWARDEGVRVSSTIDLVALGS